MPEFHSCTPADGDITVFEAVNNDLKETYVTWTSKSIFQAMGDLGKRLPQAIAHWRPDQEQINFRSLDFKLSRDEARRFIARHSAKPWPVGWQYIVDAPPKVASAGGSARP